MASLQGLDHIGEKIFKFHKGKDILNFRLVCKSWQQILDNPMYWLKKLNKIGQSKNVFNETSTLIRKASKYGILPTKIGYCLLVKYIELTERNQGHAFEKSRKALMFRLPLLYFALIPKQPDLALIQFLAKISPQFTDPMKCATRSKSITKWNLQYGDDPMNYAVKGNHSLEVIKILIHELKGKFDIYTFVSAFKRAITKQDIEMCKFFCEQVSDEEFKVHHGAIIHQAFEVQNIPILNLLISKKKGQFKFDDNSNLFPSLLHRILDSCDLRRQYGQNDGHKCVEMTKLILPKLHNVNYKTKSGKNMFDRIFTMWRGAPCILGITRLIAPLTDTENYGSILKLAVNGQDLELVKEFGEKMDDKNDIFSNTDKFPSALEDVIRLGNVEILKYFISKHKSSYRTKGDVYPTPLHNIIYYCGNHIKIHRCVEMAKLILPKVEDINAYNCDNKTLLEIIVKMFRISDQNECFIDIVKLIAPICTIKKKGMRYPLPIKEELEPYLKRKSDKDMKLVPSKKVRSL